MICHLSDINDKIQSMGNSTGQMTQCLQQINSMGKKKRDGREATANYQTITVRHLLWILFQTSHHKKIIYEGKFNNIKEISVIIL